ncbi:MAG: o-succinylbenzoate synthase [Desulfurococcales archaeon ex4484_58]|nr:MAG: o-succinylbenzoate synthase [Desulfurococcales archaeon ex4484_58]
MEIERIVLYHVVMKLREDFETSFGKTVDRHCIVFRVDSSDGLTGWGEAPVDDEPLYSWETVDTTLYVYREFIIPILMKNPRLNHPSEYLDRVKRIRGYRIAKAGLEFALWDLYSKQLKQPLYKVLGGVKNEIESGVSIGVIGDMNRLLRLIGYYLEHNYKRIKIKIAPSWDIEPVKIIRREYGDIPLQVDANAAYTLEHVSVFKELDRYGLLMIEQPLSYEDLYEHSILQDMIKTPICLDESIKNLYDVKAGYKLGSYRVINVKPARVGGLTETLKINEFAEKNSIPIWIGGMLETGIGRAFQVAAATLSSIKYPNDISESTRYYEEDIVEPPWCFTKPGILKPLEKPGIGVEVVYDRLLRYSRKIYEYTLHTR